MENLKGTKNGFIYEEDVYTDTNGNYTCYVKNNEGKTIVATFTTSIEEVRLNAKLIADAGNTIQKCDKLPSQLLEENLELLDYVEKLKTAVEEAEEYFDRNSTTDGEGTETYRLWCVMNDALKANELINKISK